MEPLITFLDTDDDVITAQTVVHGASAEEIYALISNPRRHHELDGSGTVRRQVKGPEHPGVGEKTTQHMRMFGIPYRMTSTVTRAEPGRAFAWRMPTGHLWSWEILPASVTGAGEGHGHEGAGLIIRETFDASQARLFGRALPAQRGLHPQPRGHREVLGPNAPQILPERGRWGSRVSQPVGLISVSPWPNCP